MPTTTYRDLTIHYTDEDELNTLLDEIWRRRIYYVDLPTNTPTIIDAGAHIGLATLYLHSLYPRAKFICVEPNPQNLKLLEKNLRDNNVENFTIIPKALSNHEGKVKLFVNPKWTVFSSLKNGGWTGEEKGEHIEVEATSLSSLISEHVDLLKIDIEGEETVVLREAQNLLKFIDHIIIEFHKTKNHNEDLVLKLLKNSFKTVDITTDERRERNKSNQLLLIEASRA